MSSPILNFAPKIDPEAPAWLRQHLSLIYQKLGNHTQAMSLLAQKPSGSTTNNTTILETVNATGGSGGGGGGGTTNTIGAVNDQSGASSYSTQTGDYGAVVVFSYPLPVAVTLTTQGPPWFCWIANIGTGTVTVTPMSGTVNGSANYPVGGGSTVVVAFDGTNWWVGVETTGGVRQIVAGTNVSITPLGGTGVVTVNSTAGTGVLTMTSNANGVAANYGNGYVHQFGQAGPSSTGVSKTSLLVTFPVPFAGIPRVVCNAVNDPDNGYGGAVFACYPRAISVVGFSASLACGVTIGGSGPSGIVNPTYVDWIADYF